MDEKRVPKIDRQALEQQLKADFQRCIDEVVEAIDTARIGTIIDDSEEPVRDATSRLRQSIFQKAIQMKTNAAEAAFSPSEEPDQPEASSEGTPDGRS
jgi:hypothetical protein